MGLFKLSSKKVDSSVKALFTNSLGPRQRPSRESEKHAGDESEEKDDEQISEVEEDFDDEDEEAVKSLLDRLDKGVAGQEQDQASEGSDENSDEVTDNGRRTLKRKRKEEDMEAEDRYLQKLAEDNNVDEKEQEEAEEEDDEDEEGDDEGDKSKSHSDNLLGGSESLEIEKAEKTVFVGNITSKVITEKLTYKQFKKLLSQYGDVQSIRFRSIAFSEILPRKAAFIKQKLHGSRSTVNAYVVFASKESLKKTLGLNGKVMLGTHWRVDSVTHPAAQDAKRCIFVGNVDTEQEEEPFWKHFGSCGEIEYVRLVRDSKTNVGKGFGYVQFKDSVSVSKALLLNDKKIEGKGRKLRVTRAKNIKKKRTDERGNVKKVKTLSNDERTRLGRAKNVVGKASKAQINSVIEGSRAKAGDTVHGLNRKRAKKPRITKRSKAFKSKSEKK